MDGNIGTCGITDFAQEALGDIVFVDLPEVGDKFDKGDSFGSVESVKAASDVYAPVGGTVTEINEKLMDEPALVNTAAEGDVRMQCFPMDPASLIPPCQAWFVKLEITDEEELGSLLDGDKYKQLCEKEKP